jgi:hypothetical protein
MPLVPEPAYLILQELMHALSYRLHRLASAGNPEGTLDASNQQVLGYAPALDAAASTVQDLVAVWLREKLQLRWECHLHRV